MQAQQTSVRIQKAFIDEGEQVPDNRDTFHYNRCSDRRFCGGHQIAAVDDTEGEPIAFFNGLDAGPAANQSGLASLERADAWLNSPPLIASALRGKVIIVVDSR